MSIHPTQIKLVASGELIPAELHDSLALTDLIDAQALWTPFKLSMAKECLVRNVPRASWPQSIDWDWANKAAYLKPYAPGPFSPFRMLGLRAQGEWQGMMLASSYGHKTKLGAAGRDLVYVDFVETAPWNWDFAAIGQTKRFAGVGLQLIELAVRWSDDLGYKGRLGLQSLPQSEGFYRNACGMTDLGPDPASQYKLHYFELDEKGARSFLEEDNS